MATGIALLVAGVALLLISWTARRHGIADALGGEAVRPVFWIGYALVGVLMLVLGVLRITGA